MKKILTILLMCISLYTQAQVNKNDSLALVDLYNSTDGDNWTRGGNWLSTFLPINSWDGITIQNNRVTAIDLSKNSLSGSIPISIGNLTQLKRLNLSDNNIFGIIPNELGLCSRLETINLSNNKLNGEIPFLVSQLGLLKNLILNKNELTGSIIFPNIVNCNMYLQDNNFNGYIDIKDCYTESYLLYTDNNSLNFKAISTINSNLYSRTYYNQKPIKIIQFNTILYINMGEDVKRSTYEWYCNGILKVSSKYPYYDTRGIIGNYYVKVTSICIPKCYNSSNVANSRVIQSETYLFNDVTLPIKFVYFKRLNNNLDFKVLNESDVDTYEIEASYDGVKFNTLEKIKSGKITYSIPILDAKMYRIKVINKNSSIEYSETIFYNTAIQNYKVINNTIQFQHLQPYILIYNELGQVISKVENSPSIKLKSGLNIIKTNSSTIRIYQ